ncbi:hypothetical protein SLEP1_g24490 [Rubroshorea leprosula]|uniref:Integrase catalytic domain-containing protein n=1 Tax=Rubroshorea leprosula TaxID=152421 RepID=A0AAV5JQA6_9ROSI|nr:hypothetical protein SLEP1_g24490 [Rubroshorea leprosula]
MEMRGDGEGIGDRDGDDCKRGKGKRGKGKRGKGKGEGLGIRERRRFGLGLQIFLGVRAGNPSLPFGQSQLPNNLPPLLPPQIPNMFPSVDHVEEGDENQPHNSAHNSASTANQDIVTTQLATMQQQFAPQQDPQPAQHALALSEFQGQSHIAPAQQPFLDDVIRQPRSDVDPTSRFERLNSAPPQQSAGKPPITWTPFNLLRSQIFVQIKNKMDLRCPGPMRTADTNRDHTRYCDFHQDHDHTTDQDLSGNRGHSLKEFVIHQSGSAPDIMYFHCFESLGLDPSLLQRYDGPIYGFNNQPVQVEGVLTLNVAFGNSRTYVTPSVWFLVVKMASFFNVVIGRPTLTEIRAVVPQSHLCMKFPTPMGIATLRGNQEVARHCYITSVIRPHKDKEQTPEAIPQQILDNQKVIKVPMAPEDEKKTSFYASDEIYCYVMMPFGLKNVGATYQKMVTIVFYAQIGKNLEVYVDDIMVKSLKVEDHLANLDETFNNLRKNRMRLNPAKCIFGLESGKFIGFMVSRRGIEVNPEKIRAIAEMEPPKSVKDIQRLIGRVAALHSSKGSGASALLIGPDGYQSEHALKFNFDTTNNMAEYEVLLLGLQLALELKIRAIQVYNDSQLVVNQINSICEVVDPVMADSLSKFASDSSLSSRSVFVEVLDEPSFMKPRMMEISTDPNTPSWTDPIISFLQDGIAPEDKQEAMRLRKKASWYTLVDGVLYKRSFSLPLLRCLNPYKAEDITGQTYTKMLLTLFKDATHFVQRCPKCQFFTHLTHQPAEELTNLVAPWPFAQWGLDLLGLFVKGVGGVTHLIVGVDYFTKWAEAKPLSSLTSKKVEDFDFSSIICRYGIPNQIVPDNGTQFNCSSF